jgi:hypothetical protein
MTTRLAVLALIVLSLLAAGCRKNVEGESASAAPGPLSFEASVASLDARYVEKDSGDEAKGLVKVKVVDGAANLSDHTRVQVWRRGADPEEHSPETTGWADNDIHVPAGTWDLRLRYDEGTLSRGDGWIRNVTVSPGQLWKAEASFTHPMQYLRFQVTQNGQSVNDFTRIEVYESGADTEEISPMSSFWATERTAVRAGRYDLVIRFDRDGVRELETLKDFEVAGDRSVRRVEVAIDRPDGGAADAVDDEPADE